MNNLDLCAHGAMRDAYCPYCVRDKRRGATWAEERMNKDPGFRKAVYEHAENLVRGAREEICKAAVLAAMRERERIQKALALRQGVWWNELSPLTPLERGVVMDQLRRMWGITQPPVDCRCPDAEQGIHWKECRPAAIRAAGERKQKSDTVH